MIRILPCELSKIAKGLAVIVALTPGLFAETVLVESRTTGGATGGVTADPPYAEVAPSWSGSSAHTPLGTPGLGSRYAYAGTPSVRITPTLIPGNTYSLDISHISGNSSPDVVVSVTYSGCTGTASSTTAFQTAGATTWENVGSITVDDGVTQPSITFTYASGTLASTGGRWYSDAYRFVNQSDPCVSALPQLSTVDGPLAAGQTFVDVPAIADGAVAVTVYANGVQIGELTSGVTAGVNRVMTSPLVKGQIITATQRNGASVDSCRPNTGPIVGGGPNARIRVALSIKEDETLTGPIGTDGGIPNLPLNFLGATNVTSGFGTAPNYGRLIQPSNDWQVVTFLRGNDPANPVDPTFGWSGTTENVLRGDFGIFDAIAIAIDDLTDSGPYAIYIDNVMNGETVIQDFESATNGQAGVLFTTPATAGITDDFLLAQPPGSFVPNVSVVTNAIGDGSQQSAFISWQFKDTARADWVRLLLQGTGTPNPMVDLREPISFRILLLPVGEGITQHPPAFFTHPSNMTVLQNGAVTLSVSARGAHPLSYQWRFDGVDLPNATNSVLRITNAQPAMTGGYSVFISNHLGTATSSTGLLTVVAAPATQLATMLWQIAPGSRPYVSADNNQRGIAYNPMTGNLLLVSRTPSNAVHVLDGTTGDYLFSLNTDTNIVRGGTFALNMIGVTTDGWIYAGNVTANGTTTEFKIYQWQAEDSTTPPTVAWHGDPGLKPDFTSLTNRWGDTFVVRGSSLNPEIFVGSRAGRVVSMIVPALGDTAAPFPHEIPDASSGNFGFGLAAGEGDTVWAKGANAAPLRLVQLNIGANTGSILNTFTTHPTLRALGYDPVRKLLAAVSLENPDNLRLFDASDLAAGLPNLDTDFFPRDNPNGNGTGAVAFSGNRVYALDSNNGIIAMQLNPYLASSVTGSQLRLRWTSGTLESASTVDGAYTPVSNATSPYDVDTSIGQRFFRLNE